MTKLISKFDFILAKLLDGMVIKNKEANLKKSKVRESLATFFSKTTVSKLIAII